MQDFLATLYSFIYILAVVGVAFILHRFTKLSSELVRKFIHILVSFWVFILVNCYESFAWSLVGPIAFIVINALFVKTGMGKYLGMGDRKRDNGLIYYPISITILIVLAHNGLIDNKAVVASVLTMGLGDGLAAIVGSIIGRHRYNAIGGKKSIEGTLSMLAVTITVLIFVYPEGAWYMILLTAIAATALENLTPLGFDNITVPLGTALILGAFYGVR